MTLFRISGRLLTSTISREVNYGVQWTTGKGFFRTYHHDFLRRPERCDSRVSQVNVHFEILPERGRLHVNLQHGKLDDGKQELLVIQLTARGAIDADQSGWDLACGLQMGHHALVRTFFDACSEAALDHWGVVKKP